MLPRQLQKTGFDHAGRQFLLADADKIAGAATDLQHQLHITVDLLRVVGALLQENVIVDILTNDLSVRIHPIYPIGLPRLSNRLANRRRGGRWGDR